MRTTALSIGCSPESLEQLKRLLDNAILRQIMADNLLTVDPVEFLPDGPLRLNDLITSQTCSVVLLVGKDFRLVVHDRLWEKPLVEQVYAVAAVVEEAALTVSPEWSGFIAERDRAYLKTSKFFSPQLADKVWNFLQTPLAARCQLKVFTRLPETGKQLLRKRAEACYRQNRTMEDTPTKNNPHELLLFWIPFVYINGHESWRATLDPAHLRVSNEIVNNVVTFLRSQCYHEFATYDLSVQIQRLLHSYDPLPYLELAQEFLALITGQSSLSF